ncbi:MAG: N-acetylmuramoyl-L-alanine amidase [Kofleriaceae bacterium]
MVLLHPRPHASTRCAVLLVAGLVGGCAVGATLDGDGDEVPAVRLEGEALLAALGGGEVVDAPIAFARLGLEWDGAEPDAVQVQVRERGGAWSRWQLPTLVHTEVEVGTAYVAELDLGDVRADAVRLRAVGSEAPARVRLEFQALPAAIALEDGVELDRDEAAALTAVRPLGIPIVGRAAWGARSPRCASGTHTPRRITLHHTDTPNDDTVSAEARVRGIQAHHTGNRKWCDIGYHFLIAADGRIFEGRPIDRVGSHTKGNNTDNVGIALIGAFNARAPTAAQRASAERLIAAISRAYDLPLGASTVRGHRDYLSTDCPGDIPYAGLRDLIDGAVDDPGEQVPPPPPAGEVAVRGVVYQAATSTRLAGATVTLSPGARTTTTTSGGGYRFDGLAPGTYTLTVRAAGFLDAQLTRELGTVEVWASVGLSKAGVGADAGLQGVVFVDGNGANRVPGATVAIDGGPSRLVDDSGYFKFEGLPPGTYTLRASAPGRGAGVTVRSAASGELTWASVELGASTGGATAAGSCAGACGVDTPAPGSAPACYCDPSCEAYGDCCADYAAVCATPATPPPAAGPTCVDRCGDLAPAPGSTPACYCDPSCEGYGDCCDDYALACF